MPTEVILYDAYQGPPIEQMNRFDRMTCVDSKQCIYQGGFPFSYLVDSDGTSVLGDLGLEDRIIWYKFLGNLLFYYLIIGSLFFAAKKLIRKK